ncbi:hypothetical protein [Mesorhizobium sp. M0306]|uniref:hypothetical protein n=1 Tax=unclassified Mesorhizobium TaxID=325217 RepID=UPI00333D6EC1
MGSESKENSDGNRGTRNPFGVMDVPTPNDEEVSAFAAGVKLEGTASDENAAAWGTESDSDRNDTIEGSWSSRWNGGADPTIPGDSKDKWKSGRGEVRRREREFTCCSIGMVACARGSSMRGARVLKGWWENISI